MTTGEQLKKEGMTAFQQKSWSVAVQKFEQAEAQFRIDENSAEQAEMLNNLGVLYKMQGSYDQSLESFENAISLFQSLSLLKEEGQAYGNMGDLHAALKNSKKSVTAYLQSSAKLEDAKAFTEQSQVLRTLSLYHLRQGQWLESVRRMEQSLSMKPRVGIEEWVFRWLLRFAMSLLGLARA